MTTSVARSVALGVQGLFEPIDRSREPPAVGGRERAVVDGFGDLVLQVAERVARIASMIVAVTVHDFIDRVLDIRRELVVDRMSSAMELSVPLKVETKSGKNWGEME